MCTQFNLFWLLSVSSVLDFFNKTVILLVNSLPSDKPSLQNKNFVLSNPQYSLLKTPTLFAILAGYNHYRKVSPHTLMYSMMS